MLVLIQFAIAVLGLIETLIDKLDKIREKATALKGQVEERKARRKKVRDQKA